MSKRKKKNGIMLFSLLVVLLVLSGAYYLYRNQGNQPSETNEDTSNTIMLASIDAKNIKSVLYQNDAADLKLILDGEVWKSEAQPDRPINQAYVKNIINIIDEIVALKIINDNPENLEEYGLSRPAVYVQATDVEGNTLTLRLGDKAVGGQGYYASVNEDKTVYLIAITYGTGLAYSDNDMTEVEKGPSITAENIHHIEVIRREEEDFELIYHPENTLDKTTTNMFAWVIQKPYEEGYTADGTKVTELLPKFSKFNFVACIDYNSEDKSQYGLDNPLASILVEYYEYYTVDLDKPEKNPITGETVDKKTYYDEKVFKIYVGNQDASGNYYVRKEDSNAIYTMKAADIDPMLEVKAFENLNSFVDIVNIDSVKAVDITIEDKEYRMEIERKTEKKEGKEETIATYYYNGNQVEESNFKAVYQALISAKYDTELKKDADSTDRKPYMRIKYHMVGEENQTITASYIPYSESFYLVEREGTIRFLADRRRIDGIASQVIAFKGKNQ